MILLFFECMYNINKESSIQTQAVCYAGGADMNRGTIVNIGTRRFDKLREEGRFYIDKTGFIREW